MEQRAKRAILITVGVVAGVLIVVSIGGYIYWQTLTGTPQYSIALLAHAARSDDQQTIAELVDTDAVVASMFPQVVDKAVEIYARGLPIAGLANKAVEASGLIPIVKERVEAELPGIVRAESDRIPNVPFPLMVLGVKFYLDVHVEGDNAIIKSRDPEHTTEILMQRVGDQWKIVGVKDPKLAAEIAKHVGNEVMQALLKIGTEGTGIRGLDLLLRQFQPATP
jgi:hypothetical protein